MAHWWCQNVVRKHFWNPLDSGQVHFSFKLPSLKYYLPKTCAIFICFQLTRLPRLISLAHHTTELPFLFAQEQNLLASGNLTWAFFCPALTFSAGVDVCWSKGKSFSCSNIVFAGRWSKFTRWLSVDQLVQITSLWCFCAWIARQSD